MNGNNSKICFNTINNIGFVLEKCGKFDEALDYYNRLLRIQQTQKEK